MARTVDYRKKVEYPADGLYTIKKLNMTKMGGRHPATGRKVFLFRFIRLLLTIQLLRRFHVWRICIGKYARGGGD